MSINDTLRPTDVSFFDEHTSRDAILKYTRAMAGSGSSYSLDHDYKDACCHALALLAPEARRRHIRSLEFGCGGGMNLLHSVSVAPSPFRDARQL
jgi:hypothetical protein